MIKKILKNTLGSVSLSYAIILSFGCIVGIGAVIFLKNINNFQSRSATNIETQGMVSPSLDVL